MNDFLKVGIIFTPLYIIYNYICLKRKMISIWVGGKHNIKVIDEIYFKFQFKNSVIMCLVMWILIIHAIILQISTGMLPLLSVVLVISVSVTKYLAIKKGYINKVVSQL